MATYSTNDFKAGLKVMIDNSPGAVVENEFVKPGKGQAFNRVKIRNLKTGASSSAPSSQATPSKPQTWWMWKCSFSTTTASSSTS